MGSITREPAEVSQFQLDQIEAQLQMIRMTTRAGVVGVMPPPLTSPSDLLWHPDGAESLSKFRR